jgi:hypothetical protein
MAEDANAATKSAAATAKALVDSALVNSVLVDIVASSSRGLSAARRYRTSQARASLSARPLRPRKAPKITGNSAEEGKVPLQQGVTTGSIMRMRLVASTELDCGDGAVDLAAAPTCYSIAVSEWVR